MLMNDFISRIASPCRYACTSVCPNPPSSCFWVAVVRLTKFVQAPPMAPISHTVCSLSSSYLRSTGEGDCSLKRYQHLAANTTLVHMSLPFVDPGSDRVMAWMHSASTFPSRRVQLSLMSSGVPSRMPRYLSSCLS